MLIYEMFGLLCTIDDSSSSDWVSVQISIELLAWGTVLSSVSMSLIFLCIFVFSVWDDIFNVDISDII